MAERKEGYLEKRGKGSSALGRQNWKRRWFVLEGSSLSYYDKENSSKPIKSLPIRNSDTVEDFKFDKNSGHPPHTQWTFRLLTHKRVLEMCAETEGERLAWMNALRAHIKTSPDYTLAERSQ